MFWMSCSGWREFFGRPARRESQLVQMGDDMKKDLGSVGGEEGSYSNGCCIP